MEAGGIADTERGAIEDEPGKVRRENFRRGVCRQRGGLLGAPETNRDAGLRTPGAAGALVGGGA